MEILTLLKAIKMASFIALFVILLFHGLVEGCGLEGSKSPSPVHDKVPDYFAIDIDGTFLTRDRDAMNKNIKAFRKALDAGHRLFFATGRGIAGAEHAFSREDFDAMGYNGYPGVYLDGAIVYDDAGNVLSTAHLNSRIVKQLALLAKKNCYRYKPLMVTSTGMYLVCEIGLFYRELYRRYVLSNDPVVIDVDEIDNHKFIYFVSDHLDELLRQVDGLPGVDYNVVPVGGTYMKITPINTNKAVGIDILLRHYGTDMSNCGCIGDHYNDLEMFGKVGVSYAVGNAVPAAKRAAKHTIEETNNEAAFAKVMERVYGIVEAAAKNRRALRKLIEAGYQPLFCTGRPLYSAVDVLRELSTEGVYKGYPGIYDNGGIVFNKENKVIHTSLFSKEFVSEICDKAIETGLESTVLFLSSSGLYSLVSKCECYDRLVDIWEMNIELRVATKDEILDAGIIQIMVSRYHELMDQISAKEGVDFINKMGTCKIGDMNPLGTTKAAGLKIFLDSCGADFNDCCYIGDGLNDTEAMEAAHISFAVANASDEVKKHAKYVLKLTNEEAAFAEVVKLVYGKNCLCGKLIPSFNSLVSAPKHFAVDIDGTFLTADDAALAENRKAFANALRAGYNVFFCTGRPLVSSLVALGNDFVQETGYRGYPGIYHNGAVVYGKSGNVLRMEKFSEDFLSGFCSYVEANRFERYVGFCDMHHTYMLTDDSSQMKAAMDDVDIYEPPIVVTPSELLTKDITLMMLRKQEIITGQPQLSRGVDYIMKEGSLGGWDVTTCNSTKADGLKILLDSYGSSEIDCGFIGNGTNDIEAMELCAMSFAVGDADPGVKQHAKYALNESHHEGAFRRVIEVIYGVS
ncbi:putative phosphatase [Babesia sp. Xinjiang]|uniref:putative phosphatase n=1 Tax=Babesia sp. Xinjiang TaxID=462227 RepID=UPI000A21AA6D|nr:putative phosphatase [Babesia sp. Xinjiang]ORM39609.1 putative phosphatase [Babesia sp. Xinjiang]